MEYLKKIEYHLIETAALILTGAMKFIFMDWLNMRALYIAAMCLFWAGYVLYRYRIDNSVLRRWGFRKEHFGRSLLFLLPFLGAGIYIAFVLGKIDVSHVNIMHILPVLLLYPLWGLVQQFMMVVIVAGIIHSVRPFNASYLLTVLLTSLLRPFNASYLLTVLLTSLLFGCIHAPNFSLMIFTFVMEITFLTIYFKWRNLWAIGLAHGWIATFLLYYIHGRDLWAELFTWFQM
jgi:uncharacterized protein